MTCLSLSQKLAANFFDKAETMTSSKHEPGDRISWKWDYFISKAQVELWHLTQNLEFPHKKPPVVEEAACAASHSEGRRAREFAGQSPPQVMRNILSGSAPLLQAHCCKFGEAVACRIKWINGSLNKRNTTKKKKRHHIIFSIHSYSSSSSIGCILTP